MQEILAFGLTKAELLVIFVGFWMVSFVVIAVVNNFKSSRNLKIESVDDLEKLLKERESQRWG